MEHWLVAATSWVFMVGAVQLPVKPMPHIRPGSIVCVFATRYVTLSGRLPGEPVNISATIASRLEQLYTGDGGKAEVTKADGLHRRFVYNGEPSISDCRDLPDLEIIANYQDQENGRPYRAVYTIRQGLSEYKKVFSRDLNPTGQVRQFDPAGNALDIDITAHVAEILKDITISRVRTH